MGIFAMPSLGADMEAGTLVEWLVKPGDQVHRGDVVAVVETQKGAIEIECFEEGEVRELQAEIGEALPVGAPLALILGSDEAAPEPVEAPSPEPPVAPTPVETPTTAPSVAPSPLKVESTATPPPPANGTIAASPAARVRAKELGVDLSTLSGTGPGGAIVLDDVEKSASVSPFAKPTSPIDEMRKAIAAAMTRSKQTIPHFYVSQTIDAQPAVDWLAAQNECVPPADRLLLAALFVRASVLAAGKVKTMNGLCTDGTFRPSQQVNAGVAIALRNGGLVAPALIGADQMDLAATMSGIRDLVTRARAGRLRSSEMAEGTITVSALGDTGAEAMSGVIFPPQVTLVGLGAPQIRPWVLEGQIVPRATINLTLSVDHRVSDGRQAARFIAEFETLITSPETL